MKTIFLLWFIVVTTFSAHTKIIFKGLDLSNNNQLLFQATPETAPVNTLFITWLNTTNLQQLTVAPEKMTMVEHGQALYLQNALGTMRLPLTGGLPQSVPAFPAFAKGSPPLAGRLDEYAVSNDGRWILFLEPVSYALSNLILLDIYTGAKTTIVHNIEQYDRRFPARWSSDSRVFIYCYDGKLYYYTVNNNASLPLIGEQYRLIGEGGINSVYWGTTGDFFYLKNATVYRVQSSVLFARERYTNFLEIGTVVGTIPFAFDPILDVFWLDPNYQALVIFKKGRTVFFYPLNHDNYEFNAVVSFPYLILPPSCFGIDVYWSAGSNVTIAASILDKDTITMMLYRLNTDSNGTNRSFFTLEPPAGTRLVLSPDGSKAIVWGKEGAVLYDFLTWETIRDLTDRPVFSVLWNGNEECIVGDYAKIERIRIANDKITRSLICLSSVEAYGFEEHGGNILAQSGATWFITDGQSPWVPTQQITARKSSIISPQYRTYLEQHIPMIRLLSSLGTVPAVSSLANTAASSKQYSADIDLPGIVTHGSRTGGRDIALCFDLYDDATGVLLTLNALRRFNFTATFFLNGEFIRRNPSLVTGIVEAGHEAASLFFAPLNLTDSRYHIDEDFIIRGLARNEDEFFSITGQELNLLWHPPYYLYSQTITTAAARMGYTSVNSDLDAMDPAEFSTAAMIDRIMDTVQPGSIIPVRIGLSSPGTADYLFNHINVLLDAVVKAGYRVVPLSSIIKQAD